jgi:hypothetical protein
MDRGLGCFGPKGQNNLAQGNALSENPNTIFFALKGQHNVAAIVPTNGGIALTTADDF